RRDRRHETLLDTRSRECRLEVRDVGADHVMPCVAERPDADRRRWSRAGRDPRIRVVIRGSKPGPVTAVAKARQHDMPRFRALRRHLIERLLAGFDAGQALPGITPPGAIIDALRHRFAKLAISRHLDAEFALIPHDIHNRRAERCLELARICRLAGIAGAVCLDQRIRPRQAADMAGQNVILARPHVWSPRYYAAEQGDHKMTHGAPSISAAPQFFVWPVLSLWV